MIRRPRPASLSALPSLVAVALMGLAALGLAAPHEGHAQTPGKGMVSAAHPLASEAGARILRSGGDAIDAAIAVQAVLTLVEPQSSGIGGGAFLLYWDAEEGAIYTYDGRETAPQSVTPELFLKPDGSVLKGDEARVGGRFVGVPGVIAMLGEAHAAHGDLVWSALFQPAIGLAERGFEVTPRLNQMIRNRNSLRLLPNSFAYFYDGAGAPLPVGTVRANPAYAETLLRIAAGGPDEFYGETIGIQIVEAVQGSAIRPGGLTLEDLKTYNAKLRPNLCAPYRTYTVCSMGPPSSGGLTVLQILKLIERFDMGSFAPNSAEALHLIIEASKLAFADRNTFIADPDFVEVPVEGLLDTDYLAARSALIDPDVAARPADPGAPPLGRPDLDEGERAGEGDDEGEREGQGEAPPTENTPETGDKPVREGRIPAHLLGVDRSEDVPSTSHFTIVDGAGNIVTMTTTIEAAFGSHVFAGGFLLNNQLRDFNRQPRQNGQLMANAPAPGKRPRSSMSPTLVFDADGTPVLAIGSPGGPAIIGYVTKTLIGVLDWGLSVQAAIDLPNAINMNRAKTALEQGGFRGQVIKQLVDRGHDLTFVPLTSGLHGIALTAEGLDGGADPRREGVVLSE